MRNGMSGGAAVALVVFASGLLAAAFFDLRARRIPNAIVLPLLLSGLTYNATLRGWGGARTAAAGAGVGLAILIVPFAARLIGGGDVKLLAAVGAWLGPSLIGWVALRAAALAGVLVVALLVRHRSLRRAVADNLTTAALTHEIPSVEARPRSQSVPLGAAIAAAATWVALAEGAFRVG